MSSEKLSPETYRTDHPVMRFDDLGEAQGFITNSKERDPLGLGDPLRIVLGDYDTEHDVGEFLVATSADAERLVQAGYEYGDDGFELDHSSSLTL